MIAFGRRVVGHQLRHGFHATVTWLPREQLAYEDARSREAPLRESAIDRSLLRRIGEVVGWRPEYDMFATHANAVCQRYAARLPEPAASRTDGFSAPPAPYTWAFPPFALATRAATHLAASTVPAALLAPTTTPTNLATWHALLTDERPLLEPPVFASNYPSPIPLRLLVFHTPSPVPSVPPDVPLYLGSSQPPMSCVFLSSQPSLTSVVTSYTSRSAPPRFVVSSAASPTVVRTELASAMRALGVHMAAVVADVPFRDTTTQQAWTTVWSGVASMRSVAWAVWLRV
jgi:hypothetical protein